MFRIIKISLILSLVFLIQNTYAQVIPDGIAFQAVAKDASGNAAANRTIYVKIEVLEGTDKGPSILLESHTVTSNNDGIFTVNIGKGTRISGVTSLLYLDWRNKLYFVNLKMAISPTLPTPGWNLDNEYVDLGTTQIWSVPYSFTSYRSIVADSSSTITGILPGVKGGTGVANTGRIIKLNGDLELSGSGNLKFNTTGNTILDLPTIGKLITSSSSDSLTNKTLVSPFLIGKPIAVNPLTTSNDNSIATTSFVNNLLKSDSNSVNIKISQLALNNKDSIDKKLNISDTALMLSQRFKRDTSSLSNRINLKVNTLNATIDSSLTINGGGIITDSIYVKKTAKFDSTVFISKKTTINDSLKIRGNVLIDSNLYVGGKLTVGSGFDFRDSLTVGRGARIDSSLLLKGKLLLNDSLLVRKNARIDSNLYIGGKLTVASGFDFRDSLTVGRGARIDSSLLLKGKLYLKDSLIASGNVRIDSNLNVGKKALIKDSLSVLGYTRLGDSLSVGGYARIGDSLTVRGDATIGNNLTVLGKLTVGSGLTFKDSLVVTRGARIDSSLLVKGGINVLGVSTLNDSLFIKGVSVLSKIKYDSTVLATRIGVAETKSSADSILFVNRLVTDSTVITTKLRSDSTTITSKVRLDSTAITTKLRGDSTVITSKVRLDSTDIATKVRLDSIAITLKVRGDSTVLATRIGVAEVKSSADSTLFVNRLVTDSTVITTKLRSDSTAITSKLRLDSTAITTKLRSDSTDIATKVRLDSTAISSKVRLDSIAITLKVRGDSTVLATRIGVAETKSSADSTLFVNRLVTDSTVITTKLRSDSTAITSKVRLDSTAITSKVRLDSTVITSKVRADSTVLATRIGVAETKSSADSTLFVNRLVTDSSDITTKLRSDSTTINRSLVDSVSVLNARINLKVNIADTAAMLSNRIGRDTLSLSNRINTLSSTTSTGKLSVSDTAAMLSNYARKFTKDFTVHLGNQTVGNISVPKTLGKYTSGSTVPATGKTLDELFADISTEKVPPVYSRPTILLLSTPTSGYIELGSTFNVTFASTFTQNQGGAKTGTTYKRGSTSLAGSSDIVANVSSPLSYTVEATYANAPVLNNNLGEADSTGIFTSGTATSAAIVFTPKLKKYWGASSTTNPTDIEIIGSNTIGTDCDWANSSAMSSFSIPVSGTKYIFFAFPASLTDISNISVGGFDSFNAFNKITRNVVNASGHTESYNIYVSKNLSSETISNIIIN